MTTVYLRFKFPKMAIGKCILEFPGDPKRYPVDDITQYDGPHDITTLLGLEAIVDTRELTLSFLGEMFPNLQKLRLNNSIIPSVRDIGCTLTNLRFLSLARCNLTSLDGISTISQNLEELYLAFNKITDFCDLLGMEKLKIIDFEDNLITDLGAIEILVTSPKLQALTLAGNPAANDPEYREKVAKLLPKLVYLDEKRLKPRRTKTPRPVHEPKQPSVVKFEESALENVPRSMEKMVKEPVEPSEPKPEILTLKKKSKKQAPKPVQEPNGDDEVVVAPLDLSKLETEEVLITEQLRDRIEERPPSSYGSFEKNVFPGFFKNPPNKVPAKNVLTPGKAKIFRPMSARGRPFQ